MTASIKVYERFSSSTALTDRRKTAFVSSTSSRIHIQECVGGRRKCILPTIDEYRHFVVHPFGNIQGFLPALNERRYFVDHAMRGIQVFCDCHPGLVHGKRVQLF